MLTDIHIFIASEIVKHALKNEANTTCEVLCYFFKLNKSHIFLPFFIISNCAELFTGSRLCISYFYQNVKPSIKLSLHFFLKHFFDASNLSFSTIAVNNSKAQTCPKKNQSRCQSSSVCQLYINIYIG